MQQSPAFLGADRAGRLKYDSNCPAGAEQPILMLSLAEMRKIWVLEIWKDESGEEIGSESVRQSIKGEAEGDLACGLYRSRP